MCAIQRSAFQSSRLLICSRTVARSFSSWVRVSGCCKVEAGHAAKLGFGKGINAAALTGGCEAQIIGGTPANLSRPTLGGEGLELDDALAASIGVLTQPCYDEVAALLLLPPQVPMAGLVWGEGQRVNLNLAQIIDFS
jgi:hypothetical protein